MTCGFFATNGRHCVLNYHCVVCKEPDIESFIKDVRFLTLTFRDEEYVVEYNALHPSGEYSMNVRASGKTFSEALKGLINAKIKNS